MLDRTAACLAFVLVLAACGGASDPGGAPTTSAPEATTTVAPSPETTHAPETTAAHDAGEEHEEEAEHDEESSPETTTTAATSADDAIRVVEVAMTEMAFTPDSFTVAAGETVRFAVTNVGLVVHEFRLSNPHRIEEHVASHEHGGHGDGGDHHEDADIVLELEAGATGEVTVTFPEDTTIFTDVVCLLPGHFEAGMKGDLAYAG